jgi:hypothetical protein
VELTIGPHRLRVLSDPATSLALASDGKDGDSSLRDLTIRVRHDLPESLWRETLLHEVLHMCLALTHLAQRLDDDAEEDLVRAVTPYLAQCVADVVRLRRPRG